MKKIRLLTLLVLGMLVGSAYAQSRVSGVVKSSEDGQPLAGVTVRVKGTNLGAATGPDGSYTINNAPANATLEFMYAGMANQSVALAGKSTLNVTLAPDALQANTVTVTALGGTKQDRKLGYATSTVKGDELSRTNTISPVNALQGKVAGLNIQTSGSSGLTGSPVITLRGAKSLTKNNSPIFVVDGIVMENVEQPLDNSDNSSTMYGNQLKNLNSNDYESVTVLKGAAATSIYGSRGANGAIVITTKGGKARKGIGVEVNYSHEFQSTYAPPLSLQNSYGMGDPNNGFEGGMIDGTNSTANSYTGRSFGPAMGSVTMQQHYKLGQFNDPSELLTAYKDNWKSLFQTGQSDNISIALTGGSEKATYRLSYGYSKNKGSLPNNSFNRHSINFRTNGRLNDVFSVDFSIQYSNSMTLNASRIGPWAGTNFASLVTGSLNRNTDVKWYADNYRDRTTYLTIPTDDSGALNSLRNTLRGYEDNNQYRNEQTIITRVQLNAQLTQWLDASASLSYNSWMINSETKNWGNEIYRSGSAGQYAISGSNESSFNSLVSIHSNNSFVDDNLSLDIRLLMEMYGNAAGASWSKTTNGGLVTPGLFTFANSMKEEEVGDAKAARSYRNNMVVGVGAIVNLSWKDQINLELTARNDWNSSLLYPTWVTGGANNYSVFYPSANASWVFSDTFGINPSVLSMGRLRASIAQVGSGTKAYETAKGAGGFTVESVNNAMGGNQFTANPNNLTLPNIELKPEIQQTIEFGADLRFLDGKIGLDVAYYKANTYNQILSLKTTSETGVDDRLINAGNVQNQGWEVQLDFRPINTNKVRWEFGFTFSRNKGKLKELHPDLKQQSFYDDPSNGVPGIWAFEGGAFGQIVAGPGYGYTGNGAGAGAVWYNKEDPNDPRNGQKLLTHTSVNGTTTKNPYYYQLTGSNVTGYYGKPNDKTPNQGGATYWGEGATHQYDILGQVEANFFAGFTTTLSYAGFDLFAQIDGRYGGNLVTVAPRDAMNGGNVKASLYGRDADNGGEKRINWKGDVMYDGLVIDGVFTKGTKLPSLKTGQDVDASGMSMRELINAGHIQPMMSAIYYTNAYHMNMPQEHTVMENTWFALREVSLGYNFPERWIKHVGMQSARLSFVARNICYLYNSLPSGYNPESISNNNPLTPVSYGGVPYVRSFSLSLNVRF